MRSAPRPQRARLFLGGRTQREGAGFLVRRPIGGGQISDEEADPFLLLDHLPRTNYAPGEFPGAPWHPHRGFDTVMYLLEGQGSHEDSMGNKGTLYAGDCQWMTAGSGIQHNEGTGHPGGWLHGFQCWINLPRADKMCPPAYQDIRAATIPEVQCNDACSAKVLAGTCAGVDAVCQTRVPVQYLDFRVRRGGAFEHPLPPELETAICYVYKGKGRFGPEAAPGEEGDTLLLSASGPVAFHASDDDELCFLLLTGRPIREPIVRYGCAARAIAARPAPPRPAARGCPARNLWADPPPPGRARRPFVMNTREEITKAFEDYQSGNLCRVKGTYVAK